MNCSDLWEVEAEYYALDAILPAGGCDAEVTYFRCTGYMGAGTEALVVVADMDDSYGVGSIVGETAHVEALHGLGLRDVFLGDGDIGLDSRVDIFLEGTEVGISEGIFKTVVEF